MKTSLLLYFLFVISTSLSAQLNFTFPTEWTKDFRVELENSGGMMDHKMKIRFTYDSCIYYNRVQSKIERNGFLLNARQRSEILQKLKQLRQDTTTVPTVSYDKGTDNIILFTKDTVFGVDDESDDTEIRNAYLEVKHYLVEFAMPKREKA
jgi:hypothetical protein